MSHLIDGRLRAQAGRLGVAFQAPAVRVSPRPHQTVHVCFLDHFGLGLRHGGRGGHGEVKINPHTLPGPPDGFSPSQSLSRSGNPTFPRFKRA